MDKLHAYIRVSGRSQKDEGYSIEGQRTTGQKIAKDMGLEYVEVLEGDKGVQSSTKGNRGEFEELKKRILKGDVTHIWVMEFSRLSRGGAYGEKGFGLEGQDLVYNWCVPHGVKLFEGVRAEEIEVDTKMGRWNLFMKSESAMDEGLIIRERTTRGKSLRGKAFEGKNKFMGGTVIYGYKNVDKTFQINKEEAKLVKELFKRYAKQDSITDIAKDFDAQGYKPRRAKYWNTTTLIKMLNNEHYLGTYRWYDNYSESWISHVIPQIISHSLFNKVKKQLEVNAETKGDNNRKEISLLGDILWCGDCKCRITQLIKNVDNPNRPVSRVYNCNVGMKRYKKREEIKCENKRSLNMDRTDEFVIETVKEVVLNSHLLKERVKEELMDARGDRVKKSNDQIRLLENNIKEIDKNIERIETSIASVKTKILLGEETEGVGNKIVNQLEEALSELVDGKERSVGDITRLDEEKDWINWVNRHGQRLESSIEESPRDVIIEHLTKIIVIPCYAENREGENTHQGHKLKMHFRLPIVKDGLEYEDPNNKSKGYNLINGKRVLNTDEIPFHKGGRPHTKKKA